MDTTNMTNANCRHSEGGRGPTEGSQKGSFASLRMTVFFLFFVLAGLPAGSVLAEEGMVAARDMPHQSVRDQVRGIREQRFQKMPYLDRGFIRSAISPEKIEQRYLFLGPEQKGATDILRRATAVHTQVRTSRERISLAHKRILVAFRNLFPEARFEFEERDGDLSAVPFNSMSYRFNLKQPLFRGGILWNSLLQEKAELEAAKKEYDATLADLTRDVLSAYVEYNRALEVLHGQEGMVAKAKHYESISTRKFKEGIASEIEHLNVQSLSSQVQYDHETAKQEVEIAKLELQRFLDLGIDDDLDISPLYDINDLLIQSQKPSTEADILEEAQKWLENEEYEMKGNFNVPALSELVDLSYAHRPELRVESARLQSARLEERIRFGQLMPQADFVLEFGRLGEAFDANSVDPSLRKEARVMLELHWNAMGNTVVYEIENNEQAPSVTQFQQGTGSQFTRNTVSVGIFDGLQDFADAKQAEVEKLDQIVQLEETEKEVILDVKQAYYDYEKARIQVKSSLQRVNYRQRLLSLSIHRLEKNEIQISEYLQGELDLFQELGTLHNALADYYKAKAALNHAIGISDYFSIEDAYEF